MSNIPIKGIPGFAGIDFEFDTPLVTDPTKPFLQRLFRTASFPLPKLKPLPVKAFRPAIPPKEFNLKARQKVSEHSEFTKRQKNC
jgi:hypothetical protein